MVEKFNPADLVYSPEEISRIGTSYLDARRNNRGAGVPMYLASIDRDFIPAMPGELISVIGRPGGGKTGFMMRWARERAARIKGTNRVVVYATYEQSIEELHAFNIAAEKRLSITGMARGEISDEEWKQVLAAGVDRLLTPIWLVGHSMERRKKRPVITVANLAAGLNFIETSVKPERVIDILFVDYLQRIPAERRADKTIEVSENVDRLKDLALQFGCPVVLGVQARREVEERSIPIPQLADGQWASNIEQSSDKIFSLVRPSKYRKEGEQFGTTTVTGKCQMLISLLKQKLGKDNESYWVYFNPEYNLLDELEMRKQDPRQDVDEPEPVWFESHLEFGTPVRLP